jgi:hypothetical protein
MEVHLKTYSNAQISDQILLTLPATYGWIFDTIEDNDKKDVYKFMAKLVKRIDGDTAKQMQSFQDAHRGNIEHPLSYMNRLKQMYESASGNKNINNDKFALHSLYTKVAQGLDSSARIELKRLTDREMSDLTYAKLIENVTSAVSIVDRGQPHSSISSAEFPAETIEAIVKQWNRGSFGNKRSDGTGNGNKGHFRGKCFHCGIQGHRINDCRKKKSGQPRTAAKERESKGDGKESKTDGRRA